MKNAIYRCTTVQQFWRRIIKWFDDFTHISLLEISKEQFLFGVSKRRQNWRIINWILLVVKFFIQCQKLFHEGHLHLIQFLAHLRESSSQKKRSVAWNGDQTNYINGNISSRLYQHNRTCQVIYRHEKCYNSTKEDKLMFEINSATT